MHVCIKMVKVRNIIYRVDEKTIVIHCITYHHPKTKGEGPEVIIMHKIN